LLIGAQEICTRKTRHFVNHRDLIHFQYQALASSLLVNLDHNVFALNGKDSEAALTRDSESEQL